MVESSKGAIVSKIELLGWNKLGLEVEDFPNHSKVNNLPPVEADSVVIDFAVEHEVDWRTFRYQLDLSL